MDDVPGLDREAWEMWVEYRRIIRKPLRPENYVFTQRKLAKFGPDQLAVVTQSRENEWQGLFPLRRDTDTDPTAPW